MAEPEDFDKRLSNCTEQVREMQKIVAGDSLAGRLRMEARASEEISVDDSSIAAMREAAEVIEELVKALDRILPMCGAPHDFTIGDVWQAQEQARTARARANQPEN